MKRSEFNLLVENWRKFLKGDVVKESMDDEYYPDRSEIDDQEDAYDMEQRMEPYVHVEDDDTTMDAEEPIKTNVEDRLQTGKEALLFFGQELDEKREELKLKEIGNWFNPWYTGYAHVMIEDYKEGLGYVVSEMGRPDNKLENVPSEYLTHDLDYEDENTERRIEAEYERSMEQGGYADEYARLDPYEFED